MERFGWLTPAALLVLVVVTFAAYSNSFHGEFVYDDVQIYSNPNIRMRDLSPASLIRGTRGWKVGHRPVANLSFAFNYYFGGLDTFGYHLVNFLVHLGCGAVIFAIFRITLALVGVEDEKDRTVCAGAAALVWLVHPLNTQAVSYIVQRMASLAAFFYLSAFLAWLVGRVSPEKRRICFALAGLSWLLALGTKEHTVTLPLAVLAYEWIIVRRGRGGWLAGHWPWMAAVLAVLAALAFYFTDFHPIDKVLHGFAGRPFGPGQRLMTEARVLVFYLSLFLFPHPSRLNLEHDFTVSTSPLSPPGTLLSMLFLAALLAAAVRWRRTHPLAALAMVWFFVVHLVESTIMPLDLSYEHRNYLAIVFFPLALARAWQTLRPAWLRWAAAAAVVAVLAVFTHQRNLVWHDRISLWRDCVAKSPDRLRPRYDLAWNLQLRKRLDEAAAQYIAVIGIDPGYAPAYNNLGLLLYDKGFLADAEFVLREGIRRNPSFVLSYVSLGRVHMKQGRYRLAEREFARALRLDPGCLPARKNMNLLRATLGLPPLD